MLAPCPYGTEVHNDMFRTSLLTLTILLASCGTLATPAPDRLGRADALIPAARPVALIDDIDHDVREIYRWVAICRGDPLDFLDNREYCLRIGPWASYGPPFHRH